jgi:hypothetical protein
MISPTTEPQFFELLPQMKGLKAVYGLVVEMNDVPTEAVGMALLTVSEKIPSYKRSTRTMTKRLLTPFSPGVAREINFICR